MLPMQDILEDESDKSVMDTSQLNQFNGATKTSAAKSSPVDISHMIAQNYSAGKTTTVMNQDTKL